MGTAATVGRSISTVGASARSICIFLWTTSFTSLVAVSVICAWAEINAPVSSAAIKSASISLAIPNTPHSTATHSDGICRSRVYASLSPPLSSVNRSILPLCNSDVPKHFMPRLKQVPSSRNTETVIATALFGKSSVLSIFFTIPLSFSFPPSAPVFKARQIANVTIVYCAPTPDSVLCWISDAVAAVAAHTFPLLVHSAPSILAPQLGQ